MRMAIRVRPGAARTAVGGSYGPDELVVAVTARAVDGAANRAVVAALAEAFGVRRRDVEIVTGAAARSKAVLVRGEAETIEQRRSELLRTR